MMVFGILSWLFWRLLLSYYFGECFGLMCFIFLFLCCCFLVFGMFFLCVNGLKIILGLKIWSVRKWKRLIG